MAASTLTQRQAPPLTFEFRPLDAERAVEVFAFADSLKVGVQAVQQTAAFLSNGNLPPVRYEITDARHNRDEPIITEVRAVTAINAEPIIRRAQALFVRSWREINSGNLPPELDFPTLKLFQRLSGLNQRGKFLSIVETDGERGEVAPDAKQRIDLEFDKDRLSTGRMRGFLRSYSSAGPRNLIRIYPRVGPDYVTCSFPDRLRADVSPLVEKEVEVSGRFRYRPHAFHPWFATITAIGEVRRTEVAPTLRSLRGVAPGYGEGWSAEDLVHELRRGWE